MGIYENLKKGHKTGITKYINEICRKQSFMHNFDITADKLDTIINVYGFDNVLINMALDSTDNEDEKVEFESKIRELMERGFIDFANQEPTPKQIYFYVELCLNRGELPQKIMKNWIIAKEINRLKGLGSND